MTAKSTRRPSGLILGRKGFAQISKVDGIVLSKQAKADFQRYDRENLSSDARRRLIIEKFVKARS